MRKGLPHAPLNHEVITVRNDDGTIQETHERWFCSCGRPMGPPKT